MANENEKGAPRAHSLSVTSATALVVGNMLGVGLFTTTGFLAAEIADPATILGIWVVGGILALCGADVYAELGSMMPRAGGEYVYLSKTFHPLIGFLSGWVSLLVGFSAPIALTAHAFGIYLTAAVPLLSPRWAGAALIIALAGMHMVNLQWSGRFHTGSTLFKIVLVLGFVLSALALGRGDWDHFQNGVVSPRVDQLALALVFVSFSYSGWNVAAYVAGEIQSPERNLPRALIGGTLIVMLLFLLLNLVFFYATPASALAAAPEKVAYIAANALFGGTFAGITSLLIAAALISSASAMIMAGPRVYTAMSEDGLFFPVFALRTKGGAPWASVLLQSVVALLMLFTSTFVGLLTYIGVVLSAFAGLTVLAAFAQRRKAPHARRPYRSRGWPLSPLLYLSLVSGMTVVALIQRPIVFWAAVCTLLAGIALYFIWVSVFESRVKSN